MNLRLPNFLVLGAQKGGTSSLRKILLSHPGIFLPQRKEIHFFSKHWHLPSSWYSDHFAAAPAEQCCGESTPYYLFHPQAAKRISKLLPEAKLIVLLRDPVERALSQVFHSQRLGLEPLPLAQALAAEPKRLETGDPMHLQEHSYISRSRYLEQLDRYEELFPANQILVIQSEAFFASPKATWQRIEHYLQLQPAPCPEITPTVNAGRKESAHVPEHLKLELQNSLRDTAAGVLRRYGFGWQWA